MAACSIFEEDEVCIQTSSGSYKYGLVLMSSEYVSSDEDEDDDLPGSISKGMVKVAWHPGGEETVIEESKVILADRSLMPGDVVRHLVEGQDSQRGFVKDMQVKCHLKVLGTDRWLYNINSKDLKAFGDWDPDREVTLDSWVGRIMEVNDSITLRFVDGARCVIQDCDIVSLDDANDKRCQHTEFSSYSYYPGQELIGSSPADYYNAKWLDTTPLHNPDTLKIKMFYDANPVTVEKVETTSVEVHWLCRGFTASGQGSDNLEAPPRLIKGDDLKRMKMLDCFEHCSVQIGDKVFYTVKETDDLSKVDPRKYVPPDVLQTAAHAANEAKERSGSKPKRKAKIKEEESSETQSANNDDFCKDVSQPDEEDQYEDVSESDSDESMSHSGTNSPIIQRKTSGRKRGCFPTKMMKKVKGKKAKKKSKLVDKVLKPGDKVAVEICYTFTTATVVWQDGTEEEGIPSADLFPIHHLDELEFFPGDFVVDAKETNLNQYGAIISCDHTGRVCTVKWLTPYTSGKCNRPEESEPVEISVYDIKDHPDYKFRPASTVIRVSGFEESTDPQEAVGQVHSLGKDGALQIWWPNGMISTCYPQDLYIISDEISDLDSSEDSMDEEEEEEDDEEEGSECSWETEDEEELEEEEGESNGEEHEGKGLLALDENKKRELDELLIRAQTALSTLLQVFVSAPNHLVHNCEQIFKEIISIANSCKELEKILKSSFLDELSISSYLFKIKEEVRKEKFKRLTKHVHQLYESRNKMITRPSEEDQNQTAQNMLEEVRISQSFCIDTDVDQSTSHCQNFETDTRIYRSDCDVTAEKLTSANGMGNEAKNVVEHEFRNLYSLSLQDVIDDSSSAKKSELENSCKDMSEISSKNKIFDARNGNLKLELRSALVSGKLVSQEDHPVKVQCENQHTDSSSDRECVACLCVKEDKQASEDGKRQREHADGIQGFQQNGSLVDGNDNVSSSTKCSVASDNGARNENSDKSDICVEDSQKSFTDAKKSDENIHNLLVEDLIKLALLSKQKSGDNEGAAQSDGMAERSNSNLQLCTNICRELYLAMVKIRSEVDKKWRTKQAMLGAKVDSAGNIASQTSDSTGVLNDAEGKDDYEATDSAGNFISNTLASAGNSAYQPVIYQAGDISPMNKTSSTSYSLSEDKETEEDVQCETVEKPAYLSLEEDSDLEKHSAQERYTCTSDTEVTSPTATRGFQYQEEVHLGHRFTNNEFSPTNLKLFNIAVRKEVLLLQSSLPEGVLVKGYEDRMDLYSVMIIGPARTPYEDGLFCFDIQLPSNYPNAPPLFHYLSYCSERLNPNLYDDGKVCVSLLGTWTGKKHEFTKQGKTHTSFAWHVPNVPLLPLAACAMGGLRTPGQLFSKNLQKGNEMWMSKSNLLQVLVSIQGLILVSEPYYNEAGYERQRGTQQGQENSRIYNEMAILKLTQSMTKMARLPPVAFAQEVKSHLRTKGRGIIKKFQSYVEHSEQKMLQTSSCDVSSASTSSGAAKFTQQPISDQDSPGFTDGSAAASSESSFSNLNPSSTPADISTAQAEQTTESKDLSTANNDPPSAPRDTATAPTGPDSQQQCSGATAVGMPDLGFPLLPASKGFCISMKHHLKLFEETLEKTVFNSSAEAVI